MFLKLIGVFVIFSIILVGNCKDIDAIFSANPKVSEVEGFLLTPQLVPITSNLKNPIRQNVIYQLQTQGRLNGTESDFSQEQLNEIQSAVENKNHTIYMSINGSYKIEENFYIEFKTQDYPVSKSYHRYDVDELSNSSRCFLTGRLINLPVSHQRREFVYFSKSIVNYDICTKQGTILHKLRFYKFITGYIGAKNVLLTTVQSKLRKRILLNKIRKPLDFLLAKEDGISSLSYKSSSGLSETERFLQKHFNYPHKISFDIKVTFIVDDYVTDLHNIQNIADWIKYLVYNVNKVFQNIDVKKHGFDINVVHQKTNLLTALETYNADLAAKYNGLDKVVEIFKIQDEKGSSDLLSNVIFYLGDHSHNISTGNSTTACGQATPVFSLRDEGKKTIMIMAQKIAQIIGVKPIESTDCVGLELNNVMNMTHPPSLSDFTWSRCSLGSLGNTSSISCLINQEVKQNDVVDIYIGRRYTIDQQCKIIYGKSYSMAPKMIENPCGTLWCMDEGVEFERKEKIRSNMATVLEGTECGLNKHCIDNECFDKSSVPKLKVVNGSWGKWSKWSKCFPKCGAGLRYRKRKCDSPSPANGGIDCLSNSIEKEACTNDCIDETPIDYRLTRCRQFGLVPVLTEDSRRCCILHCKKDDADATDIMIPEYVMDGEKCFVLRSHNSICINGKPQRL